MGFLQNLFSRGPKVERIDLAKRFELLGHTGRGTMSKVWRARDRRTGRIVAVKVLDREKTRQLEARFQGLQKPTEGEIAVQLLHPHIVRTFEHGLTREDDQFLVMEFIEGVGLGDLVESQNDTMREHRLRFMIELGEAIGHFHQNGWIHRDICPRNVMVSRDLRIKLIDFGLVVPDTPEFRRPGNRTGKLEYMAPELIKRQPTDQRIDVFSYAATCYEMWTRKLPWDRQGSLDAIMRQMNRPPRDVRELAPEIGETVAAAIMKGLAPLPADRWPSIGRMIAAFRGAHD